MQQVSYVRRDGNRTSFLFVFVLLLLVRRSRLFASPFFLSLSLDPQPDVTPVDLASLFRALVFSHGCLAHAMRGLEWRRCDGWEGQREGDGELNS